MTRHELGHETEALGTTAYFKVVCFDIELQYCYSREVEK